MTKKLGELFLSAAFYQSSFGGLNAFYFYQNYTDYLIIQTLRC